MARNTKYTLIGLAVVVVVALAFAGPALFAGGSDSPKSNGMAGCGMMGGAGCGMSGDMSGGMSNHMGMSGGNGCPMGGAKACTMMTGTVASVGRDGAVTVRFRPTTNAEKTALTGVKAGDSLSVGIMRAGARPSSTSQAASYTCPMHPEVTSTKPGKCPKCGMNLVPAKK